MFWQRKYDNRMKEEQEIRDRLYENELNQLEKQIKSLEAICSKKAPFEEIELNASRCMDMTNKLIMAKDVSPIFIKRAETFHETSIKLLDAAKVDAQRSQKISELLKMIRESYSQPSTMVKSMKEFIKEFPAHPLTSEFKRALDMENEWNSIYAWNELVKRFEYRFLVADDSEALTRSNEISKFITNYPDYPFPDRLLNYLNYLDDSKNNTTIKDIKYYVWPFEFNLLSDTYILETNKGTVLYLFSDKLDEVKEGFSKYYLVHAVINGKGDQKYFKIKTNSIKESPMLSPQRIFLQKVDELKKNTIKTGWQTFYLKIAELARTQEKMDPILKGIILKTYLNSAYQCNYGEEKENIKIYLNSQ
jgi:hypothetical protein